MVIVNIDDPIEKKRYSYYMDGKLEYNLREKVRPIVKKDDDMVFIVDGPERSGKSVFAMQLAKYVDPTFSYERMCMSPLEFRNKINMAKKGQCVVYDEAYRGLGSRRALSEVNQLLVSLMMEMGQKNLYVIIVLPTFFLLDKYVAIFRARGLFHIYRKGGKRGYWVYFNTKRKKILYDKGKLHFSYGYVKSNMRGRFLDRYTIDEELYRKKKRNVLANISRKTKVEHLQDARDRLITMIYYEFKHNLRDVVKLCALYGVKLKLTAVGDAIRKNQEIKEIANRRKKEKSLKNEEEIEVE